MKRILAFVIATICSTLSVGAQTENERLAEAVQTYNVSAQWGADALNIPQSLKKQDPESLGLILPSHELFTASNDTSAASHQWSDTKNKSTYQVISVQNVGTTNPTTGLNASYSSGNFRAETGLYTQSSNLMSSSQFYVQGAYSLFDGERLNVSLTAKVEAVDSNAINRYHGKENQALANTSIFELSATNATLGLQSTYAITKKWKLLGLISSTNLDDKIENSPLIKGDNVHVAMIGTSYSF